MRQKKLFYKNKAQIRSIIFIKTKKFQDIDQYFWPTLVFLKSIKIQNNFTILIY